MLRPEEHWQHRDSGPSKITAANQEGRAYRPVDCLPHGCVFAQERPFFAFSLTHFVLGTRRYISASCHRERPGDGHRHACHQYR
jgi:hypothetical protein